MSGAIVSIVLFALDSTCLKTCYDYQSTKYGRDHAHTSLRSKVNAMFDHVTWEERFMRGWNACMQTATEMRSMHSVHSLTAEAALSKSQSDNFSSYAINWRDCNSLLCACCCLMCPWFYSSSSLVTLSQCMESLFCTPAF